jgi:hypothetical protein
VLASAVAGPEADLNSDETDSGQVPEQSQDAPLATTILGRWVCGERDTTRGPMRFTFSIGADGWFDVTGIPANDEQREEFRRGGPYRLEGNHLICAAVNEGRPIRVRREEDRLVLKFDERLEFRLRRPTASGVASAPRDRQDSVRVMSSGR